MEAATIIGAITALATSASVVIALICWVRDSSNSKRNRELEAYLRKRENAQLVDAWIERESDERYHITLQNNSSAAIRDVRMRIRWLDRNDMDTIILDAPRKNLSWRVFPQGNWRISRGGGRYPWKSPVFIGMATPENCSPQFFESKKSNPERQRGVISLEFTDANGNVWQRAYQKNSGSEIEFCLITTLIHSDDKRLKRFVSQPPALPKEARPTEEAS